MKKVFLLLATAVLALTACEKKNPVIPGGGGDEPGGDSYKEKTWTVTLNDVDPFTADYVQARITFPGDEICAFFDLSQEEFYHGMGILTGSSSDMATSQIEQGEYPVMFGIADKNDHDALKWIPQTTNNFGHWYTADGSITTWGNTTNLAVFYAESACEWGIENPDDQTLANQWAFDFGYYPGRPEAGKQYKATVVYFYTDDNEMEYYAYVELVMNTKAGERDTWEDYATVQVSGDSFEVYPDFSGMAEYFGLANEDALFDALAAKTVVPVGINSDGSQYLKDGAPYYSQSDGDEDWASFRGVFFSADGDCTTWNSGTDHFYTTMYWYTAEGKKTIEIDITPFAATEEHVGNHVFTWGFKQGDKLAYMKINITLETAVPWAAYSIEGTTVNINMTPNSSYKALQIDFDNEALAAALGVENLVTAVNEGTVVVVGLNADGEIAKNEDGSYKNTGETPYGHWFNKSADVCGWGTEACVLCFNVKADDSVYVLSCQMPESCAVGDEYSMKQRFIAGEASVDVTYNVKIVETIE